MVCSFVCASYVSLFLQQVVQHLRHLRSGGRAGRGELTGVAADSAGFNQQRHGVHHQYEEVVARQPGVRTVLSAARTRRDLPRRDEAYRVVIPRANGNIVEADRFPFAVDVPDDDIFRIFQLRRRRRIGDGHRHRRFAVFPVGLPAVNGQGKLDERLVADL